MRVRTMDQITIDGSKHPLYSRFERLYSASFPIFEQRTKEQQEKAFARAGYHLIGYEKDDIFIGFISYWEFNDYVYVEHFAIDGVLRGKGYGSAVLQSFIRTVNKTVLLEIDPVVDEISEARLMFYEKCGFHKNPHPHAHPPYRKDYKAHPLIVLTTRGQITENDYRTFHKDLTDTVMGC